MKKIAKIVAGLLAATAWMVFCLWLWRLFIQAVGGCDCGEG